MTINLLITSKQELVESRFTQENITKEYVVEKYLDTLSRVQELENDLVKAMQTEDEQEKHEELTYIKEQLYILNNA